MWYDCQWAHIKNFQRREKVFNITCTKRAKPNNPDKPPRKFSGNKHLFNVKEAAMTSWLIRKTKNKKKLQSQNSLAAFFSHLCKFK